MLTLNLLPEHYKAEYALEKSRRLMMFFGVSLCFISAMFLALLYSTHVFLVIQEESLNEALGTRQQAEIGKKLSTLKEQTSTLNAKIGRVKSAYGEVRAHAQVVEGVALLAKPGIYIKSLSLDAQTRTVMLAGFADTRDLVLAFGDALAKSEFAEPNTLASPITNILKEKSVEYSFTFMLKK